MNYVIQLRPNLLSQVRASLFADVALLTYIDNENANLTQFFLTPHFQQTEKLAVLKDDDGCTNEVITKEAHVSINSLQLREPPLKCTFMMAEELDAYLGAPLFHNSRCIGALAVMNAAKRFWTEKDIAKLRSFASLISHLHQDLRPSR